MELTVHAEDESSQVISVDEVDTREAVWSPSGLADSGG